jgi:hypothetical protein
LLKLEYLKVYNDYNRNGHIYPKSRDKW